MQIADKPSQDVIQKAADWAALLDDARVDAKSREACNAWCAEHPSHRLAYDRMRAISGRFSALDGTQKRTLTAASNTGRPRIGLIASAVACIAMLGSGAWFAKSSLDMQALWPDHLTHVGEQTTVALSDGSRLVVDTDTRVDVYGERADTRSVTLFRGQVLASVASDKVRPFTVRTREGSATALGTQYSVRSLDDHGIRDRVLRRSRYMVESGLAQHTSC